MDQDLLPAMAAMIATAFKHAGVGAAGGPGAAGGGGGGGSEGKMERGGVKARTYLVHEVDRRTERFTGAGFQYRKFRSGMAAGWCSKLFVIFQC